MNKLNLKKGDTFSFYVDLVNASNQPLVLPVDKIKSQVRRQNLALVDTLVIETTATEGRYFIKSNDTSIYPEGLLYTDIKINDNGIILSTETVEINVIRSVTSWT